MKRIVFLFIAIGLFFSSCDIGSSESYNSVELVKVSSVDMPTEFAKDSITEIPVKYLRPTSCHFFDGFYYEKSGMTRTVAIYCLRANNGTCVVDNVSEVEVPLQFKPTQLGTYHFKFLTGQDSTGNYQFLEYDVVVDH